MLLENFCNNWNSRVYWVGDDENESFWGIVGDTRGKVSNNASVDLCDEKSMSLIMMKKKKDLNTLKRSSLSIQFDSAHKSGK
jgi:hypothetical protein